jgi:hypothetical protein
MYGDHPKIDSFKKFLSKPEMDDNAFREEVTKLTLAVDPDQRRNMLVWLEDGFGEAASLQEEAQLMNHLQHFRALDRGLRSRNK